MTQPAAAKISEIDITRPSRALAVLRWSDYVLVMVCGLMAVSSVTGMVMSLYLGAIAEAAANVVFVVVFGWFAWCGWRHAGVIEPRSWRTYLWILPVLLVVGPLLSILGGLNIVSDIDMSTGLIALLVVMGIAQFAIAAVPGIISILMLRRSRIGPEGIPLRRLLSELAGQGGLAVRDVERIEQVDRRRGLIFASIGAAILFGAAVLPFPEDLQQARHMKSVVDILNVVALFIFIRARRYFQVSADALLEADRRPPILFLRSFTDDERTRYLNPQASLIDFSLETRLANHFMRFGPFIAIGSPKQTVPLPGAARVLLPDDEWQERVLAWMSEASLIVMYCGITKWVNWELRHVIEAGRATSLILMFPQIRSRRRSCRRREIAARAEQIREVFRSTQWAEELDEFADFADLRAMLFRQDGSMVMIRSRSRQRDAYHLAALVAHAEMLESTLAREEEPFVRPVPSRRFGGLLGAGAAGIAAIAGAVFMLSPGGVDLAREGGDRLSLVQDWQPATTGDFQMDFGQSDIRYDASVTEAEVRRVGAYLQTEGFFSDEAPVTVRVGRDADAYRLDFVIDPSFADDPLTQITMASLGSNVGQEALGGWPVNVSLVDPSLAPLAPLPRSALQTYLLGELYFTEPVTAEDAARVGRHLQEVGYFDGDTVVSVHLGWEDGSYQLRYVINPDYVDDPTTEQNFRDMNRVLSEEVLGRMPAVVHLCDPRFRTLKQLRPM